MTLFCSILTSFGLPLIGFVDAAAAVDVDVALLQVLVAVAKCGDDGGDSGGSCSGERSWAPAGRRAAPPVVVARVVAPDLDDHHLQHLQAAAAAALDVDRAGGISWRGRTCAAACESTRSASPSGWRRADSPRSGRSRRDHSFLNTKWKKGLLENKLNKK